MSIYKTYTSPASTLINTTLVSIQMVTLPLRLHAILLCHANKLFPEYTQRMNMAAICDKIKQTTTVNFLIKFKAHIMQPLTIQKLY
jgi:hypothetical protein